MVSNNIFVCYPIKLLYFRVHYTRKWHKIERSNDSLVHQTLFAQIRYFFCPLPLDFALSLTEHRTGGIVTSTVSCYVGEQVLKHSKVDTCRCRCEVEMTSNSLGRTICCLALFCMLLCLRSLSTNSNLASVYLESRLPFQWKMGMWDSSICV